MLYTKKSSKEVEQKPSSPERLEKLRKKYQPGSVRSSDSYVPLSHSRLLQSAEKPKEYVSPYSTKSRKDRYFKEKPSPDKPALPKKAQEWQLRFAGMAKTIKNLEASNKDKDETITVLQRELEEKQKVIDSLQGRIEIDRNRSYAMQSTSVLGVTAQRNKERELERKVKELEATIAKDKKQMMRLNEVNGQLLGRIKGNDSVVEQHNKAEEQLNNQIKVLEQDIFEHQQENEALQGLCQKLQEANNVLEKEKALMQHRWTEITHTVAKFANQSSALEDHHVKICTMLQKMFRLEDY